MAKRTKHVRRSEWDRHAIKAELHRRGLTLSNLAVAAGLEPSACRVALLRRHRAGEAAIATALGRHAAELWPDRYPGHSMQSHHTGGRRSDASRNAAAA